MLGKLIAHVVIFAAVSMMLSLLWVVLGQGTMDDLRAYAASPADAFTLSFWPVLVWIVWGTAVAVHAAVVVGRILRPSFWSRQMRTARRLQAGGVPRAEAVLTAAGDAEMRRSSRSLPTRRFLVAMFTDIAESTSLNERLGDARWTEMLATHREVVRHCVDAHDGTVVNTQGDGFFIRFDEPAGAVECAVDLQRRLRTMRERDPQVPQIRIGIHLGDAMQQEEDVLGHVVNLAARLMQAGDPGEITITEPVLDAVDGLEVTDRGLVALKGFGTPRHVLGVEWDGSDD